MAWDLPEHRGPDSPVVESDPWGWGPGPESVLGMSPEGLHWADPGSPPHSSRDPPIGRLPPQDPRREERQWRGREASEARVDCGLESGFLRRWRPGVRVRPFQRGRNVPESPRDTRAVWAGVAGWGGGGGYVLLPQAQGPWIRAETRWTLRLRLLHECHTCHCIADRLEKASV